ncbi:hypothetical protein QR680_011916 [Steinernema hermaphroditum]|uniref:Uncharacterized protein n=1 Tax=Steinernema hermaphroditum TaxID=289476 RepID=A0AA39LYW4_9BILA|nr:hypothetical protein QR680_011916 [Steinernema hermaphroditum]
MALPLPLLSRENLLHRADAILQKHAESLDPELLEYLQLSRRYINLHFDPYVSTGILSFLPVEVVYDVFTMNEDDICRSELAKLEGAFGQVAREKPMTAEIKSIVSR